MSNFIASFTIGNSTNYSEVWSSLDEAIRSLATNATWDETTSFYAFASPKAANEVCQQLWLKSKLSKTRDKLLVVDLTNKKHAKFGIDYPNTLSSCLGTTDISND